MIKAADLSTVLAAACYMLVATFAHAQSFQVNLGEKNLGTLTYSGGSKVKRLHSSLNNTPLRVFNGTFKASSRRVRTTSGAIAQKYDGTSKSSRKTRQIKLLINAGKAVETVVIPTSENTKLSDPSKVPANVIDPVGAIGQLVSSRGCPKRLTIYDGRRAIALIPNGSKRDHDQLTCAIKYQVVAGPGHLSPLYISKVKMQVQYDLAGGTQTLKHMKLGSGLFNLTLTRTD